MANKKEAYLSVSAMLRAREPKMLSRDKAERMLDAQSFEEAAKILADCGYADMSAMNAKEIEKALAKHRDSVFAELASFVPDKGLVDAFRLKYDYHNAKVLIKAEAIGSDESALLSGSGRISGEKLQQAFNEERFSELPEKLGKAMAEAKSLLARTANPQLADFVLDREYFAELKETAAALGSAFLEKYAAVLIDSTNLRSAVRALRMGKSGEFMAQALVEGGTVGTKRIASELSADALTAAFSGGALAKAAALGAEALNGGSMTAFELACDNALMGCVRQAKLISYGPETVIAYIAAVENEITAARMILTGRLSGIAPGVIRERLRDLYA